MDKGLYNDLVSLRKRLILEEKSIDENIKVLGAKASQIKTDIGTITELLEKYGTHKYEVFNEL